MTDAIVIGAGCIGLAVAWRLQQRGVETLVLERDRAGRGASWAAAGMLSPVSEAHPTELPLLELGLDSLRRYPDFIAELTDASGEAVDLLPSGTLFVALDADDGRLYRRLLDVQQRLGVEGEWLGRAQCLQREPLLSPSTAGAVYVEADWQVDNRQLVRALELALERAGGQLREGLAVESVLVEGGRVVGVRTTIGELRADRVVLAAGAWSARVGGLPDELVPPVRPVRGQMVCLQMDAADPLLHHMVRGRRAYLVPRADGRLLVGATSEEKGFQPGLTAGGIYDLLRGAYELLPGVYELPLVDCWSGLRPALRDNLPLLGPAPLEGLIYATGHYRGGILLTPVTAWAIAETVAHGVLPSEFAAFSFDRLLT